MKANYDFSTAKKNPYVKRLKKQLTIRIDEETIGYFQGLARELGVRGMFVKEEASRLGCRPSGCWVDGGPGRRARPPGPPAGR